MRGLFTSLTTVALTITVPAAAQLPVADSAHWARVAGAGRLWANLKLFHPALATSARLDWDSVLFQVMPEIEQASNRAGYHKAITHLLEALDDPLTRVHDTVPLLPLKEAKAFWRWEADSVLVIRLADARVTDSGPSIPLDTLKSLINAARTVVFDGRADRPGRLDAVAMAWSDTDLNKALTDTVLRTLPERRRYHSGLKPVRENGSGLYYGEGWKEAEGFIIVPNRGNRRRPTIFLVNRDGWLPQAALALRRVGRAMILGDGAATDNGPVTTMTMNMPDSLKVEIRLGELVGIGARRALIADTIVPPGEGDATLALALRLARSGIAPAFHQVAESPPAGRDADRAYAEQPYPDRAHRLLAAIRIWEVMRYFHAYRELYDDDPDRVLESMLPQFAGARDSLEYALTVSRMVIHLRDSHGFVVNPTLMSFRGDAPVPVFVRMVEGKPVVVAFGVDSIARAAGIRVGDVVVRVDGEPVMDRFQRQLEIIAGSNEAARARNVCWTLLNGPDGSIADLVVVGVDGRSRTVRLPRSMRFWDDLEDMRKDPILRILPGNIGYADLDRLSKTMVDSMFRLFRDTRGIIFDMRGYPKGTGWSIVPHLTRRQVVGAQFRRPLMVQPAGSMGTIVGEAGFITFEQTTPPPAEPLYDRPTVMLINEETQSQAEHAGLLFEAANGTHFVGSPTAGANGDVTNFYVPGGIFIGFSGHDVRHADGSQLQRVGLTPDLLVRPTIAGIRTGRDEVLERATRYLLTLRPAAR